MAYKRLAEGSGLLSIRIDQPDDIGRQIRNRRSTVSLRLVGPVVTSMAELVEKTERYEALLDEALTEATVAPPEETPLSEAAQEYLEMAQSYLKDGRYFRAEDDPVNALAAFSYGHAWLDAGARIGLFDVPTEGHLFTV